MKKGICQGMFILFVVGAMSVVFAAGPVIMTSKDLPSLKGKWVGRTAFGSGEGTKTELEIPPFILHAITSDPKANLNFAKWPPSRKRLAVLWIADAKKEETREKRLKEVIGLLRKNQRLGMK